MPLYEYKCRKCKHLFERIQKFSDEPGADCPKCGSESERQLSAPAVHFKGTGWYVTDYARKGKKDSDSESKETKESSSDKSKTSESKSEKKADKPKKKD